MTKLERDVRWLRWYALGSSAALVVLLALELIPRSRSTLDLERINIRNPDGSLALAIAGKGRLPAPMMDNKMFPAELSEGRTSTAGLIFFNESGDEVGGMIWGGLKTASGYDASVHLSFDQWKNDQVVTLDYLDDGKSSRAGLGIVDRPRDFPLTELIALQQRLAAATGAQREELARHMEELQKAGKLGVRRIFLGSEDQSASLRMKDTHGRERIRLTVDARDVARLEFLDERGTVVATYPP
jgi:hypothetical protein